MPIVLVYLGARLPLYALLNLRYLLRTFPLHEVWLVSDNPQALRVAAAAGARTFACADVNTAWAHVRERMPFRTDFRKGFWFLTLARFYALAEFAHSAEVGPFLHVEADVWLSPRFPFDLLEGLPADLAFPMEDADAGVASTLFVRSTADMTSLVDLVEAWIAAGECFTDMGFLGQVVQRGARRVAVLPSAPPHAPVFREAVGDAVRTRLVGTGEQGVFDGMAWGMDLLGEDPRNHWGSLRLFRPHRASALDTSRVVLDIDAEGLPLVRDTEGRAHALHSLHVHSKDLRMFLQPQRRIAQRVRQRASGVPRSVWLPWVLIRVLWSLGVPWIRRHVVARTKRG